MKSEIINKIIGVKESFMAPAKLSEILKNKTDREAMFELFLKEETDLTQDWFTEYFQQEHSDRKNMKQDFTTSEISNLVSEILGQSESCGDICAGTGGLTIKIWNDNKESLFYCEEVSDRAFPFLIFNLAIRNMNAIAKHGDSLKNEFESIYKLTPSEKFSDIELVESENAAVNSVVMNPPYSLPWEQKNDERFHNYGLAPKSKADYAFLLHGLNKLKEEGKMAIILPHGVLFRGAKEGEIRERLLNDGKIEAIIGLPEKLFIHTSIPVVVVVITEKRNEEVLFIDASKEYEKMKRLNKLTEDGMKKILDVYRNKKTVDKFSKCVNFDEIKSNGFNLNIPRYIDTFEEEPTKSFSEIMDEMIKIDEEIKKTSKEVAAMMLGLVGTSETVDKEIKLFANYFAKKYGVLGKPDIDKKRRLHENRETEQMSIFDGM